MRQLERTIRRRVRSSFRIGPVFFAIARHDQQPGGFRQDARNDYSFFRAPLNCNTPSGTRPAITFLSGTAGPVRFRILNRTNPIQRPEYCHFQSIAISVTKHAARIMDFVAMSFIDAASPGKSRKPLVIAPFELTFPTPMI